MDLRGEMDRTELNQLLLEAKGGNGEAFGKLVGPLQTRLVPVVYLLLGKRLRQQVDVEDVIQETLLRAHRALARFEFKGDDALFRWLVALAEHVVGDLARRHGAVRRGGLEHEVPLDPSDIQSPGVSPSRVMRREERLDRLEDALEKLAPDHREAILLSHVQRLSTNDVAERMGRSRPATAMLILRALRELKSLFGETESLGLPDRSLKVEGEE